MIKIFNPDDLKKLYIPSPHSHKGQNGKLLIIAGSKLFHAPIIWTLKVASRIVDMVFYSSIEENNELVQSLKGEFRDGIVVPRHRIEDYIQEADCVLIGPGLPRIDGREEGDDDTKKLTERLLKKYPQKKWVIDGGSLQTINPQLIPPNAILTPHRKEFKKIFESRIKNQESGEDHNSLFIIHDSTVKEMARKFNCVIVLKRKEDIVCSKDECAIIAGGNAGMTKGGTGDVLAGLIASLYCKNNDPFLVAKTASYINKKAGENLFKKVGYYFNASDLVDELPRVMKELVV